MKQFGLSLFPIGISAGIITMFLLMMLMPSSTDGFEITVKADEKITKESNQITVVVNGSTTVKVLKERIKEKTGISPTKQTLKLKNPNGTPTLLMDNETMADNDIEEDTAILLFINFEIKVNVDRMITLFSWTITVEVNETDKVEDLKKNIIGKLPEKFKIKHGIEPEKISLQFGPNDNYVLKDEKTIDEYHIKKGAIVRLSIGEFQIVVRYEKKDEMINYPIWVKRDETVAILKKKIGNVSGIEPKEQKLKCNTTNGPVLEEDKKTLKEYGIGNGTTIHLSIDKFRILVKYEEENEKKLYTFGMNRTDTVATLKEMIKNWSGIEVERQSLKLNKPDGCVTELEEDKKLGLFGVASRLTVELSIANLKILVKYEKGDEEKEHTVWVKGTDTVALLKKKIGNESGIEPGDQILKCNTTNGPLLEEDKKTLKEYGIENGTIFFLSLEFEVVVEYVPNTDWKKYKITVKKTDTLATLKDKIREKYTEDYNEYGFGTIELVKEFKTDEREPFVSLDDVVLWHEDLDEYKTMEQCGIREGSMVSVFYARQLDKEEYDQGYYMRPWPTMKKIYL